MLNFIVNFLKNCNSLKAEEDDDVPPPIAASAPGDAPAEPETTNDFAKAAATRDEGPANAEPAKAPELAGDDKQIDPSNRFASLDLD